MCKTNNLHEKTMKKKVREPSIQWAHILADYTPVVNHEDMNSSFRNEMGGPHNTAELFPCPIE